MHWVVGEKGKQLTERCYCCLASRRCGIGFTKDKIDTCNNDLQLRIKNHSEEQILSRSVSYLFKNNHDYKGVFTRNEIQPVTEILTNIILY